MKYPILKLMSVLLFISSFNSQAQKKNKPNIVFIFADDQTFNSINALGNNEIITPNLDKLVKEGVSFSNSFNMGGWNGAVCLASRAMMITGKYIWDAQKATNAMGSKTYEDPLWGDLMKDGGYDTYMTGKWHIKRPANEVFQHVVNVRPGMPNQTKEGYDRPKSKNDTIWQPWDVSKEGFWKGGRHWSEVLADDSVNFIEQASQNEVPFFMYLAFNAPHDPRQSPKEFVEMYPLEKIKVPENFIPEYPYNEEMGAGRKLRDERLAPFPRTKYAVKVNIQEYYASITHMDAQVGKILEALKASGKLENTYIIFAADHGLAVGHHGLMGKQNMYDHSMRAPLMIVGPNLPKNKRIDSEVYIQDVVPSVLEIGGIEKPDFIDFKSFLPLISGSQKSNYEAIYGCFKEDRQRMIRSNGFKLIVYPIAKKIRLFDLENDPLEMNDLVDDPKFKSTKEKLWIQLLELQEEMKDPLDLEAYIAE